MQYKIVQTVVPAETSAAATSKTKEAASAIEIEIQQLIDAGWELAGGAQIAATKLGHIMLIQTMTKA